MGTERDLKYNFVIFGVGEDYIQAAFGREFREHPQVRIYQGAIDGSPLLKKLHHYHFAYSLNSRWDLPLKSLWFKRMYEQDFDNDLPLCFIYLGGNSARYDGGFIDYVRRRDPRNKVVILHMDLISKKITYDYSILKNKVDLAVTYDKQEAQQYGIEHFHKIVYSKLIPEPEKPDIKYDVYFLGAAKDRLQKIHETYQYLTKNNIKCKFVVAGVPKEKQIDGIEYTTGISYEQNLHYVVQSKCLLEIMQGGSCDITMRAREAIAYRRKFITDCQLDLTEFFCEGQVCQYTAAHDIDISFLKEAFCPDDFNPKVDFNPLQRLYFIQEKLDDHHEN